MNLLANLRYALRYLSDPQVPWRRKIWFYLVLFYFFCPLDFLPDLFPGLGWLDDLAVLLIGLAWFARELKDYRGQTENTHTGAARTIDVEYAVCPEEETDERNSSEEL